MTVQTLLATLHRLSMEHDILILERQLEEGSNYAPPVDWTMTVDRRTFVEIVDLAVVNYGLPAAARTATTVNVFSIVVKADEKDMVN